MAMLGMVGDREEHDARRQGRRQPPPRVQQNHRRGREEHDGASHWTPRFVAADDASRLRIRSSVSLSSRRANGRCRVGTARSGLSLPSAAFPAGCSLLGTVIPTYQNIEDAVAAVAPTG
jgi:hypothetical protein